MSTYDVNDTIVAIASSPGHSARGIVRISGPATAECIEPNFVCNINLAAADRRLAISGQARLEDDILMDSKLLYWPNDRSYTRQPSAEIHTLGSPVLLEELLTGIIRSGARMALPGEFTLRAFLAGRIDLTQAEAVLGVIDSQGADELNTALRQLAGGLAGPLDTLRTQMLNILAELEAGLDFADEDIEFISQSQLHSSLSDCLTQLEKVISQIDSRETATDAYKAVLVGIPNAGKSQLLNWLSQENHAIVSQVAGTTTDFISAKVNVGNLEIELVDTAGLESRSQRISQKAQQLRQRQIDESDVVILCHDVTLDWAQEEINELLPLADLVVMTKLDLIQRVSESLIAIARSSGFQGPVISVSSLTQSGSVELMDSIRSAVDSENNQKTGIVQTTLVRAKESLCNARQSLLSALSANESNLGEELVASEIRLSLNHLSVVIGAVYTDDILDIVFGKFCIGK
ncbi:MAG: tRNA uridine-5-carboxymethylaminomethyl(34) synthesis GTPase MnmE [Planctomycetota bacterium]